MNVDLFGFQNVHSRLKSVNECACHYVNAGNDVACKGVDTWDLEAGGI